MDMQKFFDGFLVLITAVAVIMIGTWVWYTVSDKGLFTNSVNTYVTSVTNNLTGEEMSPLIANYYENYNNTGKEVVEFQINAYSDQNMSTIYGRGLQLIIDEEEGNKLYFADTYNNMSWVSMHEYDSVTDDEQLKEFYYLEINDELVAVRMDGTYQDPVRTLNGGKAAGLLLGGWIYGLFGDGFNDIYDVTYEEVNYTWEQFMLAIKNMIKSCSYGTGSYTMPLVDLGNFLHVYEVAEDGTVSDTPIGGNANEILINSYFTCDVHYSRGGMTYAKQSMFGQVAGDSNYNVTGIEFDVQYYNASIVYNLDEQDFETRYSQVDKGYYYALSSNLIGELKKYDIEINIVFNIDNCGAVNVLGLDNYALYGVKVNSLTITSTTEQDINLLVGSLKDTGLTKINVKNITINNLSGTEVVLNEMV